MLPAFEVKVGSQDRWHKSLERDDVGDRWGRGNLRLPGQESGDAMKPNLQSFHEGLFSQRRAGPLISCGVRTEQRFKELPLVPVLLLWLDFEPTPPFLFFAPCSRGRGVCRLPDSLLCLRPGFTPGPSPEGVSALTVTLESSGF